MQRSRESLGYVSPPRAARLCVRLSRNVRRGGAAAATIAFCLLRNEMVSTMKRVWDSLRQFRGSRPANILGSLLFIIFASYNLVIETSVVNHILGVLFLVIGLLGLYNQFLGESVIETVKNRL